MTTQLPKPVLRQNLLLLRTSSRLPLLGRPEEQTRTLHRLQQMRQIPPMRRITIILNIPTTSRIRQPVLQPQTLHNTRLGDILGRTLRLQQLLGPALSRPRQRDERVRLHAEDVADGGAGVEAGRQGAAGGFDGGDGGGGGARDDKVDGLFEGCG